MEKWKQIKSKTIFSSKWLTVKSSDYDIGNGVIVKDYIDIKRPHYVLVIAQDTNNKIIIVKQYRRGINEFLWEIPAGWITESEHPLNAAIRELKEETGYEGTGEVLGTLAAQPGFMNMQASVVNIIIQKQNEPKLDKDEEIITTKVSIDKIKQMIKDGEITDMGTIAALQLFFLKKNNN